MLDCFVYIRQDATQSYLEVLFYSIGAFDELQECSLKLIISLDPLHSTMFLLILCEAIEYDPDLYFTFHNVSINMGKWRETGEVRKVLYIPQCFY